METTHREHTYYLANRCRITVPEMLQSIIDVSSQLLPPIVETKNRFYLELNNADIHGTHFPTSAFHEHRVTLYDKVKHAMADIAYSVMIPDDGSECAAAAAQHMYTTMSFIIYQTRCRLNAEKVPPTTGAFTAYKWVAPRFGKRILVAELRIPEDASRCGGLRSDKCRVSKAEVVSILDINRKKVRLFPKVFSPLYRSDEKPIVYVPGHTVSPDSFDPPEHGECAHGIHCFMQFEDAVHFALINR